MKSKLFLVTLLPVLVLVCSFTSQPPLNKHETAYSEKAWIDSVISVLPLEERIAQLFMIRSYSNRGDNYTDSIAAVIERYNVGGVIFFRGTPVSQAIMTNRFQSVARTPLLIAMDAEWGPSMRLDSLVVFPRQMALGAISDNTLIYRFGLEVGRQLQRLGVHMNFAPVADVNNNPANPVINSRSFGENRLNVTEKSLAYMRGMHDAGIIAVAKHFPGHGDTDADSHFTLPIIKKPRVEIDSIHLKPFRTLIDSGVTGIMTAHLHIPSLDPNPRSISSVSPVIVTELLRNQMGFTGLVITDALEMKGLAGQVHSDSVEIKALLAGNDILILPENLPRAIRNVSNAVREGIIPAFMIETKLRKVLQAKYRSGLAYFQPIATENLTAELNQPNADLLHRQLIAASLTVLNNQNSLLPLKRPDTLRLAAVVMNSSSRSIFNDRINDYFPVPVFQLPARFTKQLGDSVLRQLDSYDLVIALMGGVSQNPQASYGVGNAIREWFTRLNNQSQVILLWPGNPYGLGGLNNPGGLPAIMVGYHDNDLTVDLMVQALFGAIGVNGRLPVSIPPDFKYGHGNCLASLGRLRFSIPEEAGINSELLLRADSIALHAISKQAFPGCRIVAVVDGKVIYDKSFGWHTYNNSRPVKRHDLYDIASLTKIMATTPALAHLYYLDKVDVDRRVSYYLHELINSNKRKMVIRDVLAHQAQLRGWIPFYQFTIESNKLNDTTFSQVKTPTHQVQVSSNLFIDERYHEVIFDSIAASPLLKRRGYLYSDLGFYWMKKIIERAVNQRFDVFLDSLFYKPLGLSLTLFNPTEKFGLCEIVPTGLDTVFRKELIHGFVHDPGAAMLGGVAGHAGLFSNATGVAVFMQMLMNGGQYGGREFLDKNTLAQFTKHQFPLNNNRRGLGFDKPPITFSNDSPVAASASKRSFGHSGFTGAYTWADPAVGLVYVFLANRIYPNASNNLINVLKVRSRIHQVFYDAIYKRIENL